MHAHFNAVTRGWSLEAKIAYYSDRDPGASGCLIWKGAFSAEGRPVISMKGRFLRVGHEVLAQALGRRLRKGFVARPSCGQRACVDPRHLVEVVGRGTQSLTPAEKFERYITKPEENGCLIWQGTIERKTRYGKVRIDGKFVRAHRLALELSLGRTLRAGTEACHTCHNPSCVNSAHLYEGDRDSNAQDAVRADRTAYGVRNMNHKLTPEGVAQVRMDKISSDTAVAERFGVHRTTIRNIRMRRTWRREP